MGLRQLVEFRRGGKVGIEQGAAVAIDARDHFRQLVIGLRSEHHVDERGAALDLAALGLRDATGDGDQHTLAACRLGVLMRAQAAEFGK